MGFGDISEGTIYPLLLRLTSNNYLHTTLKPSPTGPQRKYYTLTKEGIEEALGSQNNWKDLSYAVNHLIRRNQNDER